MDYIFVASKHPVGKIIFTILYSDEERLIQTYAGEFRNLKGLIRDTFYLENFGECGGMGRCATCMIEIKGLTGEAANYKRNEETTLHRLMPEKANVRLSCQVEIDDELANTYIKIIETI
jgi:2Fe-2S ferredoxin